MVQDTEKKYVIKCPQLFDIQVIDIGTVVLEISPRDFFHHSKSMGIFAPIVNGDNFSTQSVSCEREKSV